ncbi:hypothetical protein N9937_00040 [bacterium]|nr:hypothetical protein [bacterium]
MTPLADWLEVLTELNSENPNKFTKRDCMALDYISRRTTEALGYLKHLNKPDDDKVVLSIAFIECVEAVTYDLSDSQLLKPINGLVINKCRKRNTRYLNEAAEYLAHINMLEEK